MKQDHTPARRAAWLLIAAPALLATPAFAQEAASTVPPPVRATVPEAAPTTPAPSATAATASAAASAPTGSRTVIAPGANDVVDDARRPARAAPRAAPARVATRAAPARAPSPSAAAPAAPAAASVPAPAASAPAPVAAAVPSPAPVAAAPTAADDAATTTTTSTTTTDAPAGAPIWPLFLIAGLIVLAGVGYSIWSRRRDRREVYGDDDVADAPAAYAEPVPVAIEPAYAAPVAAAAVPSPVIDRVDGAGRATAASDTLEDATIAEAEAEEIAALTEGGDAVVDRPWLEFAMRPVRAGTSADEALVEIELTVANAGGVAARDVRVSAFMLTDPRASEMENMLVDRPAEASVDPVDIAPGEGTRIDATLAALKADIGEAGAFSPVVVADARYRLADGSEGRTSASFVIGISDDGGTIAPIDLADRVMRDDIAARLHGAVEHA